MVETTTGDPRLPNKPHLTWAARTAYFSTVNRFSPELSTELPAPDKPSPNASHCDSITVIANRCQNVRPGTGESDSYHHAIAGEPWLPSFGDLCGEP